VALAPPRLRTPWRSVYHYFREFSLDGTWERMHAVLCASE
jgi:transposase